MNTSGFVIPYTYLKNDQYGIVEQYQKCIKWHYVFIFRYITDAQTKAVIRPQSDNSCIAIGIGPVSRSAKISAFSQHDHLPIIATVRRSPMSSIYSRKKNISIHIHCLWVAYHMILEEIIIRNFHHYNNWGYHYMFVNINIVTV